MAAKLGKAAGGAGRRAASGLDLGALLRRAGEIDFGALVRMVGGAFGLADEASLEAVRADMREIAEQVSRLRERELALAGGVSQLRSKAARFDEALSGLARVQGKCVARLDGQVERARKLEHLAARRDDHITRLIRDTAGQRAELERISTDVAAAASERAAEPAAYADAVREVTDVRAKVGTLETQYSDLKRLHAGATQRVIETLESMRDRVSKLETRAAEMSREARAKAGRLDALARHVASVEGRLTTAIGKAGDALVPVATDVDRPLSAIG
jgi:chromosome segregation ATPase